MNEVMTSCRFIILEFARLYTYQCVW